MKFSVQKPNVWLPLVVAAITISGPLVHAQGIITGSLTGEVQDSTGAKLPGASVTALNTATGVASKIVADKAGVFTFATLPVGTYKVTIESSGFSSLSLNNILVDSNKATSLGAEKLETGSATESVDVTAGASLLETTQSQVTTTFDSEAIANLPTGGGLDQLALLVPGVASTHGDNFSNTNGVGISSNGQRGRSNNFELDGQSNNDNSVAGEQIFFENTDALAEVQVITNNFSAAYGRNMGSVVNYITKSGTNQIHGTAFEYYTGSWLSSLTQGQKSAYNGYCQPGQTIGASNGVYGLCNKYPYVPRFTDNTFGGTLGAPILKDKLWGFGSALFSRDINGLNNVTSGSRVFPTQAGLNLLKASFPTSAIVTSMINQGPYGVATNATTLATGTTSPRYVCPNNPTTCTATTAGSVAIPFSTLTRYYHPANFDEEVLGRLDYQATSKDRFFLRYFYQNAPGFNQSVSAQGSYYNTTGISHAVGAEWNRAFSPRWVNVLRYSFQQSTFNFDGGGNPSCTVNNLGPCSSTVTFSSPFLTYGYATNIPQGRTVKVTQVQDNVTWSFGKHSFTFGGEFDYQNSPNIFLPDINGAFNFSTLNAALAGVGSLTLASGASPYLHFTEPDAAGYFQDDWKITPSFTANLGLRYEFFGQSLNILHNLSLAQQTGANPQWSTSLPLSTTTFPYIPPATKNFEPRIGFAYNPQNMRKLVVRGGFAINFDPAYYNIALNSASAAPVVNISTITCNGTTVNCIPSAGTYNTVVHAQDDVLNPTGGNPGAKSQTQVTSNFHNPYAESYTLGVQYQVFKAATVEVRYSGNHTIGNFQSFNGNPFVGAVNQTAGGVTAPGQAVFNGNAIVPSLSHYFPSLAGSYCTTSSLSGSGDLGRENCGETLVRTRGNTAFSIYNALQTDLQTRNMYGFTGSVNWTYGKTIDNTSEVFGTSGIGNTIAFSQNPYNIDTAERALSAFNYKNVASAGLTYSLPAFKQSHNFIARTFAGLELNTIWSFNSGQPYTPVQYYYSVLGYYYANGALTAQNGTAPSTTSAINSNAIGRGLGETSMCDYGFNVAFVTYDVCRPFVGNPNAPKNTVALNTGNGYVDANGNPISRSQARLVVNNGFEALAQGTPYGNMPRSSFLGDSYNNVNFSAFKDFRITERMNMQLQAVLYNAFNRQFYSAPDPLVDDASNAIGEGTFNTFVASNGTATSPATGSATGARNIQLGARFIF